MPINSIYDVSNYQNNFSYSLDYPVLISGMAQYSLQDFTSAGHFESDKWGGTGPYSKGIVYQVFIWRPSYGYNVPLQPSVKKIQFSDGYVQRFPGQINSNLLKFNLTFEDITQNRALAIQHFLNNQGGVNSFLWTPPAPFATIGLYTCEKYDMTNKFANNFLIKCEFNQVVF